MSMPPGRSDLTEILNRLQRNEDAVPEVLIEQVYREVHRLAHRVRRSFSADHSMEPTELSHEAYLKLFRGSERHWKNRQQFYSVVAVTMRNILIDYVRRGHRKKRKGEGERLVLDSLISTYESRVPDLLALHEALNELGEQDPDLEHVVELRFFGGYKMSDIADILDTSKRTVERHWEVAKRLLRLKLGNPS